MGKTTKKRDHHHVISRWCEAYAEPVEGLYAQSGVHVDTPRDPQNCTHSLRDTIDWDAIEAENARYKRELKEKQKDYPADFFNCFMPEAAEHVVPIKKPPQSRPQRKPRPPAPPKEFAPRICKYCGKEFVPKVHHQCFCSTRCSGYDATRNYRKRKRAARGITTRTCGVCGKEFEVSRGRVMYCSPECSIVANRKQSAEWQKRYQRKYYTPVEMRDCTCIVCGKVFQSKRNAKMCSNRCRSKFHYVPRGRPRGRPKKAKSE